MLRAWWRIVRFHFVLSVPFADFHGAFLVNNDGAKNEYWG
jgi:hypothetical protein